MSTSRELARDCARMFMVGFPGREPGTDFAALVGAGVFGAVLFQNNLGEPPRIAELCHLLKSKAGRPLALAIDQEGGRVARFRGPPFTNLPPMRQIGIREDENLARRVGGLLAFELGSIGIDWDFAPVLDVDTNPANPVIGDRAFHRDPQVVARLGVALARGLEEGGVASCGKHFPGHGDTHQDSHLTLPHLTHDLERLRSVELVPFHAYARAHLAAVMTAHVVFEAIDSTVPATMSRDVLEGILRTELGFAGVLVSDDLEMKAITENYGISEAVTRGAAAGVDLFLVCHQAKLQFEAIESLIRAVESGAVPRARIDEANRRLDALEKRFVRPAENQFAQLGGREHIALAQGVRVS
jgi:beta-N-acetylhexosaminidase